VGDVRRLVKFAVATLVAIVVVQWRGQKPAS
jgi:hypothetical protein